MNVGAVHVGFVHRIPGRVGHSVSPNDQVRCGGSPSGRQAGRVINSNDKFRNGRRGRKARQGLVQCPIEGVHLSAEVRDESCSDFHDVGAE